MEKYLTIQLPAEKLREWEDAEERNAHGERLESIAGWCHINAGSNHWGAEFLDTFKMFKSINSIHNTHFSLPMWLFEIRENTRQQLRLLIVGAYGPEVLERINP